MQLHRLMAMTLAAGFMLGFAACVPTSGTPAPSGEQVQPGWDINEQSRNALSSEGEFRGSVADFADNWNWNSPQGSGTDYALVRDPISAHFFTYDATGTPSPNPNYITDLRQDQDPNTVVTMTMNSQAVWGDGHRITVDDWIATWRALRGDNPEFQVASTEGWSSLESITQGDNDSQVVFTFASVYPDWTQFMSGGPMRAESCATPGTFNSGWGTLDNDYFAGPFRVDSFDKPQQIITLVPNERWWGDDPMLDKITWRVVTVEAVASAFQSHELDYFEIGVDADALARARGVADAEVRSAPGPDFRQFTFNNNSGFLTDINVRQALVMGLDRSAIAASDLAGLDTDTATLNNNVFMRNQAGYRDMAEATGIDFDVDKAKALLEESGWTMNTTSGFYELDGKQLDVRFKQITGIKASENEALQTQQMLKTIGVNVIIDSVAAADFDDRILTDGDWDILAFGWDGTPYPYGGLRQLYGADSASNYANASIEGLPELLDQIDVETDSAKRMDLGNQVAEKVWQAVAVVPLYQRPKLIAVQRTLANFGSTGFGSTNWEDVGYMQ